MNEITLKESDVSKLKKYPLGNIISTESEILYYKRDKDDWNNSTLIKKLYLTDGKRVQRKEETLDVVKDSELSTYKELVLPNEIVTIGGKKSGFTINEVTDSVNLSLFLSNPKIHDRYKMDVLKKIGELVKKVQCQSQEFYFGDLQDLNILVGKDREIYVVDLDSSAVTRRNPIEAKYIVIDRKTHEVNKYKVNKLKKTYPSRNTDLFCYNIMVLNYIAGEKTTRYTYDEYYDYIGYLEYIGLPKSLIEIYMNLYNEKDNESVVDYLDEIESIPRSNQKTYRKLKQLNIIKKD